MLVAEVGVGLEQPGRSLPGHRGWGRSRGTWAGCWWWLRAVACWTWSLLLGGPTDLRVLLGPWGGVAVVQLGFCVLSCDQR